MLGTDRRDMSYSSSFGFSVISKHRDQVVCSVESSHEASVEENELGAFQRQVAERFRVLAAADSDKLLSIPWIIELLDSFLCCQEEFRAILFNFNGCLNSPPMDKCISDFFQRSVKALDVCNAIRGGIEQVRQWHKQLEIVLCALDNRRSAGEGQLRRAKKALIDVAVGMLDEKEPNSTLVRRNRSFGPYNVQRESRSDGHCRSLSWSVSRSWSAARQLQAMGNNMVAPRANEIVSTNGLNAAVFTMNYVLLFVMWALVAAIPCQNRGLQMHFAATRQFLWAAPILSLHERILEESKKRDRRHSCGLSKEIIETEKCVRNLNELIDSIQLPLREEKEKEVRQRVQELGLACEAVKHGLDPLERRVREAFQRIVRCRADGLDSVGRADTHN